MGSGRHSSSGFGDHGNKKGGDGYHGSAIRGRAGVLLVPMLLFATPVWAQGDTASDVMINYDVLNSLALPAAEAPDRAGAARKAAKLRAPPRQLPRSRLLVQPVREAARKPAAEPPTRESKPAPQPVTASEPTVAAEIESAPGPVISEPAPLGQDLFGDTMAAPSLRAPAVPPPPEPADSASSGTMAVVAPPPPPPPLDPPAGSETPSAPEPAAVVAAPDPAAGREGATGQAVGEQLAARPAAAPGPDPMRLGFEEGSAELSDQARIQLIALKDLLLADEAQRVQLRAYARGGEQQATAARRLSLSRARAVRAFLAEQGVAISRIDVRALGATFEDGPPDRVDIVYAKR